MSRIAAIASGPSSPSMLERLISAGNSDPRISERAHIASSSSEP